MPSTAPLEWDALCTRRTIFASRMEKRISEMVADRNWRVRRRVWRISWLFLGRTLLVYVASWEVVVCLVRPNIVDWNEKSGKYLQVLRCRVFLGGKDGEGIARVLEEDLSDLL